MKKIAIVGGAPSSEHLAPFSDPSWEIWVLGIRVLNVNYPRITRVFEIHENLVKQKDKQAVTAPNYVPDNYFEQLAKLPCPIVVAKDTEAFAQFTQQPNVIQFPLDEANALYGAQYLTSSCAYMIAMAILEGATEIGIFGVDMAVDDDEYFYQRPCMESWIGLAKGRGIKVTIPANCPLGRSDELYGYKFYGEETTAPFTESEFTALAEQHHERVREIDAEIANLQRLAVAHDGSAQAYERMAKVARAVKSRQVITSLSTSVTLK